MKPLLKTAPFCIFFIATFFACASVGTPFDESKVSEIKIGETSKKEIEIFFGKPFRTGIENGRDVWIYEYNTYSSFGKESSKDLIVVFDKQNRVLSRQIMRNSR